MKELDLSHQLLRALSVKHFKAFKEFLKGHTLTRYHEFFTSISHDVHVFECLSLPHLCQKCEPVIDGGNSLVLESGHNSVHSCYKVYKLQKC